MMQKSRYIAPDADWSSLLLESLLAESGMIDPGIDDQWGDL